MRPIHYTTLALLMASSFMHNASAFTLDQSEGAGNAGAAKLADPDDKIPFPHMTDDGQPSNNFQGQPIGNSGLSFSLTPPSTGGNSGPDAFERAKDRMQQ